MRTLRSVLVVVLAMAALALVMPSPSGAEEPADAGGESISAGGESTATGPVAEEPADAGGESISAGGESTATGPVAEEPAEPGGESISAGGESTATTSGQEATAEPLVTYEFRPNNNITRASTARMLRRIAGTPDPGSGCGGLTDVPAWARDAICWLVNNGHASGYPDKTFRPDGNITRGDAARMLHRIAGNPDPGAGCGTLTDVPVWARDAICWLVNNGHASGYPDNTFRPEGNITRGDVARMLHSIAGTPAAGAGCGGMTDVPEWAHAAICWLVNNGHASGYAVTAVPAVSSSQETAATLVNNSRTARGLRTLKVNGTLNAKAQAWSAYLARIGRLQHSNLASGVPSNWRALAENVGNGSSIRSVHAAFGRSSVHLANILGNYTHLGTGVTFKGSRVYVVQVFMRV